jgi:putative SOS response-associated peptidase YedK
MLETTLFQSTPFRESARQRGCLVPATGWYEWQDTGQNASSRITCSWIGGSYSERDWNDELTSRRRRELERFFSASLTDRGVGLA